MLFHLLSKLELELILVKLDVIIEFKSFSKCVLDEILLIFVLIKLELELILLQQASAAAIRELHSVTFRQGGCSHLSSSILGPPPLSSSKPARQHRRG